MTMRKSDKARVEYADYSCIINKYGGLVNAPLITIWSKKRVEDYIKFLKKLLPYLSD